MMYVPRGFAHAILTLTDDTEALYLVSNSYSPENERGMRWNDPRFADLADRANRDFAKDAAWPDFDPSFHGVDCLRGIR